MYLCQPSAQKINTRMVNVTSNKNRHSKLRIILRICTNSTPFSMASKTHEDGCHGPGSKTASLIQNTTLLLPEAPLIDSKSCLKPSIYPLELAIALTIALTSSVTRF